VVFTAITGDFEFGSKADDGAGLFGFGDGVFDLEKIGIEFHSPLVEIASSYLQEPHRDYECENCERVVYLYIIGICYALILRSYDEIGPGSLDG